MYDWCSETKKLLDAHLDGELDVTESLRVESHLQACPECRETFLAEKEFRALVQSNLAVAPAPEFTARCLQAALDREVRRRARARRSWRLPWIAAALALVTGVTTFVAMNESSARVPHLVKLAVDAHSSYLQDPGSLDFKNNDGAVVSSWLTEQLHFDIGIPKEAVPTIELAGGEVVADAQTRAAFLAYRMGNEHVGLLVTPPQETRLSGREVISFRNILFHPADVSGFHTLEWSDSRHTYVLVSSSPRAVYQACLICHGSGGGRDLLSGFANDSNGI